MPPTLLPQTTHPRQGQECARHRTGSGRDRACPSPSAGQQPHGQGSHAFGHTPRSLPRLSSSHLGDPGSLTSGTSPLAMLSQNTDAILSPAAASAVTTSKTEASDRQATASKRLARLGKQARRPRKSRGRRPKSGEFIPARYQGRSTCSRARTARRRRACRRWPRSWPAAGSGSPRRGAAETPRAWGSRR